MSAASTRNLLLDPLPVEFAYEDSQGGPASLSSDWPGCVSNKMTHHVAAKTVVAASDEVLGVMSR
jgi:hypothetical protein